VCRYAACAVVEAIHGGDSLIDLIIEEIQECGFAISRARATVLEHPLCVQVDARRSSQLRSMAFH
ncbi:MAG: hypothetical protein Q8O63_06535, partial [Hoeflea sp.]|nr:hypothetical protein [Hoeflea sp.]